MSLIIQNSKFILLSLALLLAACTQPVDPNDPSDPKDDPAGTITYTESQAIFPNPERGFHQLTYFTSSDQKTHDPAAIHAAASSEWNVTIFRDCYYLTDYIESDIPQWYLDRLDQNMQILRENGGKCVLQFAYKSDNEDSDKPWDATPQWVERHIDQLAPYFRKNSDVIFCMFAGFIGVWGEWYYTTGFPFAPSTDEEFRPRADMLDQLLAALPEDRQICLRTPMFKQQYLKVRYLSTSPLTEAEAYQPTAKARLAGHNDCFVASANDWGTYDSDADRTFWMEDTKYTAMGGETCHECSYSKGDNAILQMALYHWTHLNKAYHSGVLNSWKSSNHMDEVKRRLGYRLVLDKATLTTNPKAGKNYTADLTLRNVGFAAPVNRRLVELVFVNLEDATDTHTFLMSDVDPRFWMPGEEVKLHLACKLDADMKGDYRVCLNLPDPYPSLHDNPAFSIRLANENVWDAKRGYNTLDLITIN